jgi:putative SOS response-associated peptidase YedK
MCGRFASTLPPEFVARLFGTTNPLPNTAATWNLAPSQNAMVVRRHPGSGERHCDLLRWGLIPHFTKDPKGGRKPINARAETVANSGKFRDAFATRRCIVPAAAFYEWRKIGEKQPFAFARQDGQPIALAGLCEAWRDPAGQTMRTFLIITTAANEMMRPIFGTDGVGVDGGGGELGVAEPFLHQVEGDPRTHGCHAEAVPQPLGRGVRPVEPGFLHDGVGRRASRSSASRAAGARRGLCHGAPEARGCLAPGRGRRRSGAGACQHCRADRRRC